MFFSACGSLQTRPETSARNWLPETLKDVCFNSEGKGRIESHFGKFVFNAESALASSQKKFKISIAIPLIGEELLELDYGKPLEEQSFFQSHLYATFLDEAEARGKREESEILLREFVVGISRYLDLVQTSTRIKCDELTSENCRLAKNEGFKLESNELKYWRQFATNHTFQVHHGAWSNGKYRKLSIDLLQSESKLFSLILFQSQCHE